jgi:hypothetical protein
MQDMLATKGLYVRLVSMQYDVRCHELQDVLTCSLVGEGVASGGRSSLSTCCAKDRAPRFEGSWNSKKTLQAKDQFFPVGLCSGLKRNHC